MLLYIWSNTVQSCNSSELLNNTLIQHLYVDPSGHSNNMQYVLDTAVYRTFSFLNVDAHIVIIVIVIVSYCS